MLNSHDCHIQRRNGNNWANIAFDDLRSGDVMRMCTQGTVYTDEEGVTEFRVVDPPAVYEDTQYKKGIHIEPNL